MDNFKFCPDHKCIKEKIGELRNEKKFWHRLLDSKWFFWTVTGIIILCLGFGAWTVQEIYAQKANEQENKRAIEIIYQEVKEIKQDVKEIKTEMKEDNQKRDEQRERDQEKLMNVLLDIRKQIKDK